MNLNKLLKLLSSDNKRKIIAHFWGCTCESARCVNDLQKDLKLSQSNLSKHLTKLHDEGVLDVTPVKKERVYTLNKNFMSNWASVAQPIVESKEMTQYRCAHCIGGK